ncbi:hypothetical protein ACF3DV_14365 [Chlorogloeopsis fritschii PCC 9212]|uniref:Uncharacterized protein n=1 Tax=Chlorogloeopsis fritschii PCC 6912 TaxID=211165 RepID=A0A3S1A323_CHLFR|nr:hypothetical protein [Chlorogloeopsis fritschii]MBF2009433.1 hypothetical protein [Chlorogloeopsis fritschii C42_A2020_084]RUR86655.1 hypothetical protein PCC6912_00980 [Chlorogloeopsis fritschii PCC 6912]
MKLKNQAFINSYSLRLCVTPVATTRLTRKGVLAPLREANSYFESATPEFCVKFELRDKGTNHKGHVDAKRLPAG